MLSTSLLALAGASSALALSYHGSPNPALHKRSNLGAVELAGADHLKRDFFGNAGHSKRMARKVNKALNRRASTVYSTTANYYATTGGYSACHTYFSDDDLVIALPTGLYPDVGSVSEYCGKTVLATNTETGVSATLTVQDASWAADYVTLPKGAFLALGGSTEAGELAITFEFTDSSVVAPSSTSAADVTVSTAARSNKAESKSKSAAPSSSAAPSTTVAEASSSSSEAVEVKVAQTSAAAAKVAATTTAAPTTTEAPQTTTTEAYDYASASSVSKAAADAAWASSSKAEADAAWASSSSAAAASADAAWASSSSAAAAASKSSADAAWAASSSSSAAAAEQTKSSDSGSESSSSSGQVYTGGYATYYLQNGVAGHCGTVAQESDKVIALPTVTYANGAHCGQQILITRTDNGAQVTATVRDSCPTCVNNESLDLSQGAFTAIATESEGMVPIEWSFV